MRDFLIEQNISVFLKRLMKVKAHFKAPLWSAIRIEIGWSWWKRVYKYLLLISAWWCDNGRWGGSCIPLQEKPSSVGMASCWESCARFSPVEDGQFWGKSPLKWIIPEAGRLGGAVISIALQNLWFGITFQQSWGQLQRNCDSYIVLARLNNLNSASVSHRQTLSPLEQMLHPLGLVSLTSYVIKWCEVKG